MDEASIHSSLAAKTALSSPSDQSLRVPCYCEENVWRLAYRKLQRTDANSNEYFVVFITNPLKCVPMLHQLAARDPTKPIYWDYHVILIEKSKEEGSKAYIFDLDSYLPFPFALDQYLNLVFSSDIEQYQPYFRVVDAEVFLRSFGSDRTHMLNEVTGKWNAKPPTYPCILASKESNLKYYMTISSEDVERRVSLSGSENHRFGVILSLPELRNRFQHIDA